MIKARLTGSADKGWRIPKSKEKKMKYSKNPFIGIDFAMSHLYAQPEASC
jgi:hypothetical protein